MPVEAPGGPGPSVRLTLSSRGHAGGDLGAGLAHCAEQRCLRRRRHEHLDVDPVEDGPLSRFWYFDSRIDEQRQRTPCRSRTRTDTGSRQHQLEPAREAVPRRRPDTTTSPDSIGWRSAWMTEDWNSGASSRNSTPWRACVTAGQHAGGASTDDRHRGGTVAWGDERRSAFERRPRPELAEDRRNGRDLHGLGVASLREETRQPLREHRLAAPGRPDEVEVVTTRRRDLERATGLVLADDLGEVGFRSHGDRLGRRLGNRRRMRPRCSDAYRSTSSSRVSTGWTRTPGTSRASAALASGTTTCRTLRRAAARTRGRTPGTDRTVPSRPSLADVDHVTDHGGRDGLAGHERGDADGEVEAGADLGIEAGDRFTVIRRSGRGGPSSRPRP